MHAAEFVHGLCLLLSIAAEATSNLSVARWCSRILFLGSVLQGRAITSWPVQVGLQLLLVQSHLPSKSPHVAFFWLPFLFCSCTSTPGSFPSCSSILFKHFFFVSFSCLSKQSWATLSSLHAACSSSEITFSTSSRVLQTSDISLHLRDTPTSARLSNDKSLSW